jgi:hypothetical protein
MAESLRQRIVDDLRVAVQQGLGLPTVQHDVPMLQNLKVGHGYVWDYGDTYEPESTTYWTVNLSCGVAVLFRYGTGDRALYRLGNEYLAQLKDAIMADHTRSGLAFLTLLSESVVWPVVEASESNVGATALTVTIQYYEAIADPYAATAA